jgi:TonB family protein
MRLRAALIGSVILHVLVAGALLLLPAPPVRKTPPQRPTILIGLTVAAPRPDTVAIAALGPPVVLPIGAADFFTPTPRSPAPRSDVEIPDDRRAALGGGAAGASSAWTGRGDREELRAQPWNDPSSYRLPHERTAHERSTREAETRLRDPGLDATRRDPGPTLRRGTAEQAAAAPGPGPAPGPEATSARAVEGAARADRARPFVPSGAPAVDTTAHAAARDDRATAQASDERHPEPFDLTTPRAGGRDEGVAGPSAGGPSAEETGHDDGGTRLEVPVGAGQPATRARLQDSYFRALYARVLARVRWPRALALAFEQGEVVVAFTLNRDGSVADVRVSRSSGFAEFDDAVVAAIRTASPFGPVPASIAEGRSGVRVNAPFVFDNPLIR